MTAADSTPNPASAAAPASYVQVQGLAKRYPGQQGTAVEGVSFSLARGEMLALLGPSGCGKTTVLRMVAGLVEADAGRVLLAGRDLTGVPVYKRNIGMVFQSYALFPHMTVAENVGFGLEMQKVERTERGRRVRESLDLVRLEGLDARPVRQLSGGQQQRVALARALASRPDVLLLDEPLSNLDAKLRDEMRVEIRRIQKTLGMTTLFVTHDQDEALSMADQVALMHQGRIVQFGTPREVYEEPADRFVADFIGRANLLDGRIVSHMNGQACIAVDGVGMFSVQARALQSLAPQGQVTLAVRPHRLQVLPAQAVSDGLLDDALGEDSVPAVVESVAYRGDLLAYGLRVNGQLLQAEVAAGRGVDARGFGLGESVLLTWQSDAATLVGRSA